jgi:hypothetical protein
LPVHFQQHLVGVSGGHDKLTSCEESASFACGQVAIENDATIGDDAHARLAGC